MNRYQNLEKNTQKISKIVILISQKDIDKKEELKFMPVYLTPFLQQQIPDILDLVTFCFDKKTYNMLTNKNTDDKLQGGALCFVVLFF